MVIISFVLLYVISMQMHSANQLKFNNWKKVGEFPAKNGIPSIGLAGQSAGLNGGYMIVARGYKFPSQVPLGRW